ncbi:leucine-rich repeat domain-containing protein [Halosquirtibacter xylanolyticus]|uniref:leucine-rich repeat domain-containing protein n=1 Tax=Halosquirtibacter xylanolyticus TaxID=3374599 RepID=UPI00374A778F|nr:leucine-rich repeat domain-containing protein [Prolixibacteraceae bacterium]
MKKIIILIYLITWLSPVMGMRNLPASQTDWEFTEITINGDKGISLNKYIGNDVSIEIPYSINSQKVLAICYENNRHRGLFDQSIINPNFTIEEVNLLNTDVKVIGAYTFAYCKSRNFRVHFNHSVEEIGKFCFKECTGMFNFQFPNQLNKLGPYCFAGCEDLSWTSVLPKGVTVIESGTFSGCKDLYATLKGDLLHDEVERIEAYAFYKCISIRGKLYLGNVNFIGEAAFSGCTTLMGDLIIPNSVVEMEPYAFSDCTGFNGIIKLSDNLKTIPHSAFTRDENITGDLTIPEGIKIVGAASFLDCKGLNGQLTLPSTLEEVKYSAFLNCHKLQGSINLSDKLYAIGFSSFENCTSLKGDLNFPSTLNTIGSKAFKNCTGLSGGLKFPESISELKGGTFRGCKNLDGELELHEKIRSIGEYCFDGCKNLKGRPKTKDAIHTIGAGAFRGCKSFERGSPLSSNIYKINDYTFTNSNYFKRDLFIPSKIEYIGYSAYQNTDGDSKGIKTLDLPKNLKTIGEQAFLGSTKTLKQITIHAVDPPAIKMWPAGTYSISRSHADEIIVFNKAAYKTTRLIVPKGSLAKYQNAKLWKRFINIEENKTTGIRDIDQTDIYKYCSNRKTLELSSYNEIHKIVCYNIMGNIILNIHPNTSIIPLPIRSNEIYLLQIILKDGTVLKDKLM